MFRKDVHKIKMGLRNNMIWLTVLVTLAELVVSPSKTVGVVRGHQRADTLKPYSQKTNQSNHTRTTALLNSIKLSHACGATQDGWAWWRGLTKCGPLEKGMANHFSIVALRSP